MFYIMQNNLNKRFNLPNKFQSFVEGILKCITWIFLLIVLIHIIIFLLENMFIALNFFLLKEKILTFSPIILIIHFLTVVISKNPIVSLLNLISGFVITVCLLIEIQVGFFPLVLLIVYVGAIAILFLFVIMLFNLKTDNLSSISVSTNIYLYIFYFIVLPKVYFLINNFITKFLNHSEYLFEHQEQLLYTLLNNKSPDVLTLSSSLYNKEFSLNILIGFVLLASLIGAVLLSTETHNKNNINNSIFSIGPFLLTANPNSYPNWIIILYKAMKRFFFNTWSLQQWIWTIIAVIILYFILFKLYNLIVRAICYQTQWHPYVFSNKIICWIIIFDVGLNFIIGIIFMLPFLQNTALALFLLKCPIALSPFILVIELILLFFYVCINYKNKLS